VSLPAGGLFQLLNRCTFSATEQVEAGLLFGLFAGCRFGTVATANGTLPVSSPLLRLRCSDSSTFFKYSRRFLEVILGSSAALS
jgi:hypothetical protein